jgi:hypothetical protein
MTCPFPLLFSIGLCAFSTFADAQSTPIQSENAKPGSTGWLLTKVQRHDDEIYELGWQRRRGIEAYASHTSIKAGEKIDVHVSTYPVSRYAAQSIGWAITAARAPA